MYDFARKSFCQRLQELGCPDTLIKDVRDVAAAVCTARGRDGRKEVESTGNPGHLKLKPLKAQGRSCGHDSGTKES
jgi:hypothetical protein